MRVGRPAAGMRDDPAIAVFGQPAESAEPQPAVAVFSDRADLISRQAIGHGVGRCRAVLEAGEAMI